MIELSVVDSRAIIKELKEKRKFDISEFALTSLKYRLAKLLLQYKIQTVEAFLHKLVEEDEFFDDFVHDLLVPSTEMFRDPSLWRWLKEEYFPTVQEKMIGNTYRIWFPMGVDGYDLHTLTILLKELELLDKVKIYVSVLSDKSIQSIKEGIITLKKYEISYENYKRYNGPLTLDEYVDKEEYRSIRKPELIQNIEFIKTTNLLGDAPKNVKLIMFRNYCVYFNPTLQDKVIDALYNTLAPTGHLILGVKERIKNITTSNKFEVVNDSESVFKKKFNG